MEDSKMKKSVETRAKMSQAQLERRKQDYIVTSKQELERLGYKKSLYDFYATHDGKVIRVRVYDNQLQYLPIVPTESQAHYLQVGCTERNGAVPVHEIVAYAFLGPRPEGLVIDHIDRDKKHNEASNLRYVTISENAQNQDHPEHHQYYGRYSMSTKTYTRQDGRRFEMEPLVYYTYLRCTNKRRARRFYKKLVSEGLL